MIFDRHWYFTIKPTMIDTREYDFYISFLSTGDETNKTIQAVEIKAKNCITYKHYICNLNEQCNISPFTNLNKMIEFFKIGTSGKNNNYDYAITRCAVDDILVVNLKYTQDLFVIEKIFEFFPEEIDENDILKRRIAKLEKEVEHLKTKNMCEFEDLIDVTRNAILECVREYEYQTQGCVDDNNKTQRNEIDACYQKNCVFKTNVMSDDTKQNDANMRYRRLEYSYGGESYLQKLNSYNELLHGIAFDFATYHNNNRFMNIYDSFLKMFDDGDDLLKECNIQVLRDICNHHAILKIYKITMDANCANTNTGQIVDSLLVAIKTKPCIYQIIKFLFVFMETLYKHYTALNA